MNNTLPSENTEKNRLKQSLLWPVYFVALLWAIKLFEVFSGIDLGGLGVYPRSLRGLPGIFTAPFIHGDARGNDILGNFSHIISNTMPLVVLGFLVLYSYRQIAAKVITIVWLGSGLLVWMGGRASYHIGASMLIYGLAFFVFFSGVFRKDVKAIALASIVVLFYGSMVWGLLPIQPGVSWEGHIAGAITGIVCAYLFRHVNPRPRYEWELEEEEPQPELLHEDPFWVPKQQYPTLQNPDSNSILDWEVKYHYVEGKKPDDPKP